MKVVEITETNFNKYIGDAIKLNDAFLAAINESKERSKKDKEALTYSMIQKNTPSHIVIILDNKGKAVGSAYFNEGIGYSCGGKYVWLNGIYVDPSYRHSGFGSFLLQHIENWAIKNKMTLFLTSRNSNNTLSKKLFDKAGFDQYDFTSMEKVYEAK